MAAETYDRQQQQLTKMYRSTGMASLRTQRIYVSCPNLSQTVRVPTKASGRRTKGASVGPTRPLFVVILGNRENGKLAQDRPSHGHGFDVDPPVPSDACDRKDGHARLPSKTLMIPGTKGDSPDQSHASLVRCPPHVRTSMSTSRIHAVEKGKKSHVSFSLRVERNGLSLPSSLSTIPTIGGRTRVPSVHPTARHEDSSLSCE